MSAVKIFKVQAVARLCIQADDAAEAEKEALRLFKTDGVCFTVSDAVQITKVQDIPQGWANACAFNYKNPYTQQSILYHVNNAQRLAELGAAE